MSITAKVYIPGIGKQEVLQRLRKLPGILSGRKKDLEGVGTLFRSHITHHTYTKIFEAFMAKSDGKADEFGQVWKPLSPATIASRPISRIERYKLGVGGVRERGLLTPAQNRQWKGIFASTLGRLLKSGVPLNEAKPRAGRTAWSVMISRGAKTKLGVFGRRKVYILRVTDRLVDSLSPGEVVHKRYRKFTKDQIADFDGNTLIFGTKVPYAAKQHAVRPLWPTARNMATWNTKAMQVARDAVVTHITRTGNVPRS